MQPKRVILVRHGDDPPDDRAFTFFHRAGFEPVVRRPFRGESLDDPIETLAGVVVHGGPYNAFDTELHPFLKDEYRLIGNCIDHEVPLLGICQGAQMIALHLGAEVGPKPDLVAEFGYYDIEPTTDAAGFMDGPIRACQSHFHTFGIPEGATRLAGSALFPNQAFRHGQSTYALQFHAEVTVEGFRRWQENHASMYGKPGVQSRAEQDALMPAADAQQAAWFYAFMQRLFGKAQTERAAA